LDIQAAAAADLHKQQAAQVYQAAVPVVEPVLQQVLQAQPAALGELVFILAAVAEQVEMETEFKPAEPVVVAVELLPQVQLVELLLVEAVWELAEPVVQLTAVAEQVAVVVELLLLLREPRA
jgi:hypothetical protein